MKQLHVCALWNCEITTDSPPSVANQQREHDARLRDVIRAQLGNHPTPILSRPRPVRRAGRFTRIRVLERLLKMAERRLK